MCEEEEQHLLLLSFHGHPHTTNPLEPANGSRANTRHTDSPLHNQYRLLWPLFLKRGLYWFYWVLRVCHFPINTALTFTRVSLNGISFPVIREELKLPFIRPDHQIAFFHDSTGVQFWCSRAHCWQGMGVNTGTGQGSCSCLSTFHGSDITALRYQPSTGITSLWWSWYRWDCW